MNVLFIGNSYTYFNDMDKLFEGICRENGHPVNAFRVTKGGRKMISYLDPEDPLTQQLESILRERHYDVCFLQEQSLLPARDYDSFKTGMTHVKRMVGSQADRFILYATWARKAGSPDLVENGWTPEQMKDLLHKAYCKLGEELDMTVSPVGLSFWHVVCNYPNIELHRPDMSHSSYLGSCLAALTHYHTLFGEFPAKVSSLGLDETQLAAFKAAVCR